MSATFIPGFAYPCVRGIQPGVVAPRPGQHVRRPVAHAAPRALRGDLERGVVPARGRQEVEGALAGGPHRPVGRAREVVAPLIRRAQVAIQAAHGEPRARTRAAARTRGCTRRSCRRGDPGQVTAACASVVVQVQHAVGDGARPPRIGRVVTLEEEVVHEPDHGEVLGQRLVDSTIGPEDALRAEVAQPAS